MEMCNRTWDWKTETERSKVKLFVRLWKHVMGLGIEKLKLSAAKWYFLSYYENWAVQSQVVCCTVETCNANSKWNPNNELYTMDYIQLNSLNMDCIFPWQRHGSYATGHTLGKVFCHTMETCNGTWDWKTEAERSEVMFFVRLWKRVMGLGIEKLKLSAAKWCFLSYYGNV